MLQPAHDPDEQTMIQPFQSPDGKEITLPSDGAGECTADTVVEGRAETPWGSSYLSTIHRPPSSSHE